MKHSSGPWRISHNRREAVVKSEGGLIATCDAGDYSCGKEEGYANALFISLAPEMAEALQTAVDALNNWPYKGGNDADIAATLAYNTARAILSKLEVSNGNG